MDQKKENLKKNKRKRVSGFSIYIVAFAFPL